MSYYPSVRTRTALSGGLLGKVFGLVAFSLVFAAIGGLVGARYAQGWILPLVLLELGLIVAVNVLRNKEGWNLALLYAFTFVSGMTLGPLIAVYAGAGLGYIVVEAAVITGAMTAALGGYALTTRRDFSGLAPYLFVGLIGLIVAGVVNIFVGGGLMSFVIGWVGAGLFSLMLVFDVQRAKSAEDTMGNAVVITLSIYLDIINLFMSILRILSYLQGGDRR